MLKPFRKRRGTVYDMKTLYLLIMMKADGSYTSDNNYLNSVNLNSENSPKTREVPKTDDECKLNLKKNPRKVIHFSDGTIEEYSSDEDEVEKSAPYTSEVNPSTMTWGPWLWYKAINVGSKSLEVCDYLGEHLASFFGITTPKYQYEIDEFNRIMEEEEERKKKEDMEMGGWSDAGTLTNDTNAVKTEPLQQNDKF